MNAINLNIINVSISNGIMTGIFKHGNKNIPFETNISGFIPPYALMENIDYDALYDHIKLSIVEKSIN